MATINIKLPAIPTIGPCTYKHYYIIQAKGSTERFYLYLLAYEPSSLRVNTFGNIVAYQKYGKAIQCGCYRYIIGQENWIYEPTSSGISGEIFSNLTDSLIYNNFTMKFDDACYNKNPMPDDQVIPAPELELPKIPYVHNFAYKHYYITQDRNYIETYHLYLLTYEPVSLQVNNLGNIVAYQKYGKMIYCRLYSYTIGQEDWTYLPSSSGTAIKKYIDLADSLIYNNFTMKFNDACYNKNSMPNDQMVPALKVELPKIPYIDNFNFQYKHYYITQDKNYMETYHLYLLAYEPVSLQVNNLGKIVAFQERGEVIYCRLYSYSIGLEDWTYLSSSSGTAIKAYNDFVDSLIYNNFNMIFEDSYYKKNPMPDDQIVPAPSCDLPPIPQVTGSENKYQHYVLMGDSKILERYYLHLLEDAPTEYYFNPLTSFIYFKNSDNKFINMKTYTYLAENSGWSSPYTNSGLSIASIIGSTEYNNFDILIYGTQSSSDTSSQTNSNIIYKAPIRRYKGDGTGTPTTGWVKTTIGTYYYINGYKHKPTDGWLQFDPDGDIYYLAGEKNWARVESEFKKIQGETYYFDENGVILTGPNHKIEDKYYDFDSAGRLIGESVKGPDIPSDYYFGTDEKKQIEYIFGTNPGTQSWSGFSASLANQVGKNIILVEVPAWKFGENNNKIAYTKRLRIHKKVSDVVVSIFTEIFNSSEQFVIDDATTAGYADRGNTTSLHNYGIAIDINWESNPWLTNEGGKKTDGEYRPGIDPLSIEAASSVVQIFKKYGWYWGAEWTSSKDYMHFAYMNH